MNEHFATYSRSQDCFPANAPRVFQSGMGCHVTADDGREFIDFGMALRSVILGYCYPKVDEAVKKAIDKGISFTRSNPYEDELKELLKAIIPCAEEVKFGKNGSDATSAAVKLARAYTGRDIVLIARENPFISQHDWFIGRTEVNSGIPYREYGATKKYLYIEMPVDYKKWDIHPHDIAAIILDPATVDITKEKLQYIRDLCDRYEIIMILDEVISGFRYSLNGVQGLYGVTPDLATFGKAMGNGHSISALCGKKELFDLGLRGKGNVFLLSGTYFSETTGLAAAIATIKEMQDKNVPKYIDTIGSYLCEGLMRAIYTNNMSKEIKFTPAARTWNPQLSFSSMELKTLFDQCMIKEGILAPYWAPSYSHACEEIEQTILAAEKALATCRKALDDNNVNELLIDRHVEKPVFRRT